MERKLIKYIDDKNFSYGDRVISIDTLTKFFIEENHFIDETVKHFELGSQSGLYQILKHYNIKKPSKNRGENSRKGYQLKSGFDNPLANPLTAEKRKHTCLERYGVEYSLQDKDVRQKIKNTCIDKYGVDNAAKADIVKEKVKENNIQKWGVSDPTQSDIIKKKLTLAHQGESITELLWDRDKLYNLILEIPESERSIKNIGIKAGLIKNNQSWLRIYPFLEKYNFLDNSQLNILPKRSTAHSYPELELREYIRSLGFNPTSDRTILNGKEIDIYIAEKKVGIEFNGDYFHSDIKVGKYYHQSKSKLCESKNIRLIHIYECEWDDPTMQEKIKNLICIALGKVNKKIYARDCEIKQISNQEAKPFNDKNHLQGHRNAKVTYGLFYNNELVQLMSFSKNRKYEWEIIRGCPGSNNIVVGGVSKLFKHFLKDYNPSEVFSYCDFNKFDGKGYEAIGMKFIGYTGPDKFYSIDGVKINRNPSKRDYLENIADFIIYGSGSKKYLWTKSN